MAQITDASLRTTITERLQAAHVEVTDMSGGCGQAFTTLIVSPRFQGLSSLKRHRLVNAALKEEIAAIHAWTAKCQTPDEWERDKAKAGPSLAGTVDGQVEGTND
ncbi:putative bolA-like protein C8C9.11 [Tolypocladium ophioglossoides CBS 100239]|uniref:Putative bolA-like protein C8C9.11 n=1 Tax=Tolypocladium ophioglossoides (strain CBS 100239) TaxID=1163406 RepID=A0A0L0NFW0_TOLOC|nr:putative bolA-like protein C8C9.11 [Tolypocladium ophioglossoides CBS 100239]